MNRGKCPVPRIYGRTGSQLQPMVVNVVVVDNNVPPDTLGTILITASRSLDLLTL